MSIVDKERERITVTVAEAAELYGVGENSFRKLVNRKDFPKFKVGRKILIIRSQLMSYMEKLTQNNSDKISN